MKDRLRRISVAVGASLIALLLSACDLNPQPLPPGFSGGTENPGANDADGGQFGGSPDGSGNGGTKSDSGIPGTTTDGGTGAVDSGTNEDATVPPAGDASVDAATDARADAETDAETDASTDAETDGESDAAEDAGDGDQ